jgi:hypothetical protein
MKAKLHAAAGALALATISTFWLSTALSELLGDAGTVASVKSAILYGMAVLIPAMAVSGGSGFSLGKGWKSPTVKRKALRMKIAAANGVLVLVPSAIFLALRAAEGVFDGAFVAVQALELAAGALNITLLSLNMRDGFRLRRPARTRVLPVAGKG